MIANMVVKGEENEQLQPAAGPATLLLTRVSEGDSAAVAELLPLVYDQLRAIAGGQFRGERANHTLQPTALVHEAYLKLVGSGSPWSSQAHFCAVAATAMRQILSNHARTKLAALNQRYARMVELRFFGGLTVEGIAELEGVFARTVKKDGRSARAWLRRELGEGASA